MKLRPSTSSPTFSIATFLAEQSRVNQLFGRSNLARALGVRIKDGTLYVPRPHEITKDAYPTFYSLKSGFHGTKVFSVEFTVKGEYAEEHDRAGEDWDRVHYVLVPHSVAGHYCVKTDKHGFESMVWEYSENALNFWARQTQKTLYENRLTALRRERETSDEAIAEIEAVLSRVNKRLT